MNIFDKYNFFKVSNHRKHQKNMIHFLNNNLATQTELESPSGADSRRIFDLSRYFAAYKPTSGYF